MLWFLQAWVSCKPISFTSSPNYLSVPILPPSTIYSVSVFFFWSTIFACLSQTWKILVIYQFDMAVYTKIFLKFPKRFWPVGKGKEFFLYASTRRGYYAAWQVHKASTVS